MPTITKELGFDMGHRLLKHESKCRNVHGHRYTALITAHAEALDQVGRVVDFSVIKEVVGGYIDRFLDHGYCGELTDALIPRLHNEGLKVYVLPGPPTAEVLAAWLLVVGNHLLKVARPKDGILVRRVQLYETPTSSATATVKDAWSLFPTLDPTQDLHAAARNARHALFEGWVAQSCSAAVIARGEG